MWGNWLALITVGLVGLALVIGLALFASPLIAVVIAVVVGGALLAGAALRRSDEKVEGGERARVRREATDIAGAEQSDRGAPAGGEGAPGPGSESEALPASPGGPRRSA